MFFQPIWLSHKQKTSKVFLGGNLFNFSDAAGPYKVFVGSNFIDFPGSAGPSRRRRVAACWRHHKEGNSSPRQCQRCSRPPVPRHLLQDLSSGFLFFIIFIILIDADLFVMILHCVMM